MIKKTSFVVVGSILISVPLLKGKTHCHCCVKELHSLLSNEVPWAVLPLMNKPDSRIRPHNPFVTPTDTVEVIPAPTPRPEDEPRPSPDTTQLWD